MIQTETDLTPAQEATLLALGTGTELPYKGGNLTRILKALEHKGLVSGREITPEGQERLPKAKPWSVPEGYQLHRGPDPVVYGFCKEFNDPQIKCSTCWETWFFDATGIAHRIGDTYSFQGSRSLAVAAYNNFRRGQNEKIRYYLKRG